MTHMLVQRQPPTDGRLMFSALVLCFIGSTLFAYVDVIARDPSFSDNGFMAKEPSLLIVVISLFFSLIPVLWLRRRVGRASDFSVIYLYIFVFVPSCVMIPFVSGSDYWEQIETMTGLAVALLLVEVRRFLPPIELTLPRVINNDRQFALLLWVVASLGIALLLLTGSISIGNLSLDVYEQRADFFHDTSLNRAFAGYLANWIAAGLAPVLLVYGLHSSRYALAAMGVASAVLTFAATSFRSHLVVPLMIAGVYILLRRFGLWRGALTLLLFSITISIVPSVYDFANAELPMLTWTIQFRLIGNNGFLSGQYFEYFAHMPKGFFADTFGRFFFEPNYSVPISQAVGESFSTVEGNHANANLWADGYGNLGWFGVLFATLSLIMFLWVFDSLARNKNVYVVSALGLSASFFLANTSVHSMLTSNGGLFLLLLILVIPAERSAYAQAGASEVFRQ